MISGGIQPAVAEVTGNLAGPNPDRTPGPAAHRLRQTVGIDGFALPFIVGGVSTGPGNRVGAGLDAAPVLVVVVS